jgi:hypothetical protein
MQYCREKIVADQKLVSYVRESLGKGANANAIRAALVRNGYPMQQVEAAFHEASHVRVHHVITFSPVVIGLVVAVLISLGGFGYFILNQSSSPSQLLDVEIRSVTQGLNAGDEANVVVELTNMGAQSRYDVEVKAELVDSSTGQVIASQLETVALETKSSPSISLKVPSNAVRGNYVMRVIAEYDGKRSVASTTVSIASGQPSCSDGVRNQNEQGVDCGGVCKPCGATIQGECNDFNACTSDTLTNGVCVFTPVMPCCGNGVCETGEAACAADCKVQGDAPELSRSDNLERIKLIATSNPDVAARECGKETIQEYKDSCYSNVATTARDVSYCDSIEGERLKNVCIREVAEASLTPSLCGGISREDFRDTCYISFVTEYRDYSVCEQIVNENLRQSCLALKALAQPAEPVQPPEPEPEEVYESPYV